MTVKISRDRFCVNRKIAPNLSLAEFFSLVASLGINKVEIRNDMQGGSVTDGAEGEALRHSIISPLRPLMRFTPLIS